MGKEQKRTVLENKCVALVTRKDLSNYILV